MPGNYSVIGHDRIRTEAPGFQRFSSGEPISISLENAIKALQLLVQANRRDMMRGAI